MEVQLVKFKLQKPGQLLEQESNFCCVLWLSLVIWTPC